MSLYCLFHRACSTLVAVEIHAGTIEDPHILPKHGECEEIRIVTDPKQLAAHGIEGGDVW